MNALAILIVGVLIIAAVAFLSNITASGRSGENTTTTIYPPNSQIKILSVQTGNLSVGANLYFNVTFQNIGASPVYYIRGCGSSLSFSVSPPGYVKIIPTVRCLCAEQPVALQPGAAVSVYSSSCGTGSTTIITKAGDVTANLVLALWTNSSFGSSSYVNFSKGLRFH